MQTKIIKINSDNPEHLILEEAAACLKLGEPIVIPTETVYGLAGNAFIESSISRIYEIKGRDDTKPLPVMISDWKMLELLVESIPEQAKLLGNTYWPGPLTIVLKSKSTVSSLISGQAGTIGIRYPSHWVPLKLMQLMQQPLVVTSANLSGHPARQNAKGVYQELQGKVSVILDGGESKLGKESTVVDCSKNSIKILRIGALSEEQISTVVQSI